MPSTTSSSVSRLFASSTVMTPSLPTFCIAWAIISPISRSPLAEIVPTWAISSLVEIFVEHDVAALRAQRHLDGVGQRVDAAQHALAGVAVKFDFLSSHFCLLPLLS